MANPPFPILTPDSCALVIRQRTRLQRLVSQQYYDLMRIEYESIREYLPPGTKNILDIGGGLGGVHLFTFAHVGGGLDVHILDRDHVDPVMRYGFRASTEAYNSFAASKEYLTSGGIPADRITTWNADSKDDIDRIAELKFDAVISLRSWCFHYPADVYIDLVDRILSPNGTLIVDVRLNTPEQKALLCTRFPAVVQIATDHTASREAFRRITATQNAG